MEPKNGGLEDDVHFQLGDFRFNDVFSRGLAKKKLVSISELSELSSVTVSRFQERRKRRARQGNMKQIWSTGHTQDFDPVLQVIGSWNHWNHENSRV